MDRDVQDAVAADCLTGELDDRPGVGRAVVERGIHDAFNTYLHLIARDGMIAEVDADIDRAGASDIDLEGPIDVAGVTVAIQRDAADGAVSDGAAIEFPNSAVVCPAKTTTAAVQRTRADALVGGRCFSGVSPVVEVESLYGRRGVALCQFAPGSSAGLLNNDLRRTDAHRSGMLNVDRVRRAGGRDLRADVRRTCIDERAAVRVD